MDVYDSLLIVQMFPRIFWNSKHNVLYPLSALGIRTQWLIFNLLRATHRVVGQKSPRVDRKLNDGLEVSTTSLKMLPCQEVQRARRFCGQAGWEWGHGRMGQMGGGGGAGDWDWTGMGQRVCCDLALGLANQRSISFHIHLEALWISFILKLWAQSASYRNVKVQA